MSHRKAILWLQGLLVLLAAFLAIKARNIPLDNDLNYFKSVLVTSAVAFLTFLCIKRLQYGRIHWISIYFLFSLSYLIVHFQLPLLSTLGYETTGFYEFFLWNNIEAGNTATLWSALGIVLFFLGNTLINGSRNGVVRASVQSKLVLRRRDPALLTIGAYICYFLFFVTSGSYKSGYYFAGDEHAWNGYFNYLFVAFLTAAIIERLYHLSAVDLDTWTIRKYIRRIGLPITLLAFWHVCFSIYVGDRGPVITYTLLYFSIYIARRIRISFISLLLLLVVFSVLMAVMGGVRSRGDTRSYTERLSTSTEQNTHAQRFQLSGPLAGTLELALSGRCLNHAVANVPDKYPYRYGYYQLKQLLAGIPFSSKVLLSVQGSEARKFDGSANFITFLIQGNDPKYGDGTSPTADLYLDFGAAGVLAGLFIFGLIFQILDRNIVFTSSPNLFVWACALIYLSGAFYLGRSSLLIYFQKIVPVFILIAINHLIIYKSVLR